MRLKTLSVVVAVLAVLAAVAYYFQRPAPAPVADARVGQPLVDRAIVEKATAVHLTDQGKTVDLARQPDGSWRVASYYDLPADFAKLTALVGGLADAKLQRLVTSNPERIAKLDFKDATVALAANGQPLWSVTLGKTSDTGGRYVRFGDEKKAFLTDFSGWIESDGKNWANAELLNLKPEAIAKVEVECPDGTSVTATRGKKEDAWAAEKVPAGEKFKAEKIAPLLSSVTVLRFTETSDPADAAVADARAHLRTVKLTTFDQKTVTIAVGRKPEIRKPKPVMAKPEPAADQKSPAPTEAKAADGAKKDETAKEAEKPAAEATKAPEEEVIPAGPVFAFVSSSDASAPVNAMMKKRAFQVSDYAFTAIPEKAAEFFEPLTPPAPPVEKPAPAQTTPEVSKPDIPAPEKK